MVEPQLKQERAVKTRQAIISAAAEVFDESGYLGASMREIMKRAGVTLGAVYFHFPNKEALATAVMNSQPETIMPRLASDGLQRLVDLTLVWSHQLQVDKILRAGVRLAVEQTGAGLHDPGSFHEWQRIMEECLLVARERGELDSAADVVKIAEFVVGACTGMQLYSDLVTNRSDLPRRTVAMWELLIPSIASESGRKSVRVSVRRAAVLIA
ncbi:ScbR family autoregulator-binding transcription factor [Streptomyces sp. NBC_00249]|uniref:ScbR family autoregulator-binding transcription factor n=1 Tax=Streptomyces sp. NBC_00249 TaxID=2975690 RepID=UPI00225BD612|nr:ScbR family autoregulator-binding transcription factor [Streptomyces sp. NBC_00249]MCX5199561.1 ScbR family autoregulator-binding transcription factor [Streptomyces sp. NBC_00249]